MNDLYSGFTRDSILTFQIEKMYNNAINSTCCKIMDNLRLFFLLFFISFIQSNKKNFLFRRIFGSGKTFCAGINFLF